MTPNLRIHEAFNARAMATEDVCNNFVITPHFFELATPGNSVIVGPRGSGKTTLMRMLHVESLNIWSKAKYHKVTEEIKYSGVFIPTDRLWRSQYEYLNNQSKSSESPLNIHIIFAYHVLEKLAQTIEYRARREDTPNSFLKVKIDKSEEQDLVKELSDAWFVSPKINSLRSLCIAVKNKWRELVSIIESLDFEKWEKTKKIGDKDFITTLDLSVSIINSYFGQHSHIWTLLFDELELAPDEIIQQLIDQMRGGSANLNFKLSMSPYHKGISLVDGALGHMRDNDFNYIDLTNNSNKAAPQKFAHDLASRIVHARFPDLEDNSLLQSPKRFDLQSVFRSLAEKDGSFSSYLSKQKIYVDDIPDYPEKKMSVLRKFQYVAHIRNEIFDEKGKKRSLNRALDYYAGPNSLFKALEYNPRMIISVVNSLLERASNKSEISVSDQIMALKNIRISFEALINTIAVVKYDSLAQLIFLIGDKFKSEIDCKDFQPQPTGSFKVSESTPENIVEAIGLGVNAGALIKVIDNSDNSRKVGQIVGQRFRLSHIFAHKYLLPLQLLKHKDLIEILGKEQPSQDQIKLI